MKGFSFTMAVGRHVAFVYCMTITCCVVQYNASVMTMQKS